MNKFKQNKAFPKRDYLSALVSVAGCLLFFGSFFVTRHIPYQSWTENQIRFLSYSFDAFRWCLLPLGGVFISHRDFSFLKIKSLKDSVKVLLLTMIILFFAYELLRGPIYQYLYGWPPAAPNVKKVMGYFVFGNIIIVAREELFFRGFVQTGLSRLSLRNIRIFGGKFDLGDVFTTTLFMSMHFLSSAHTVRDATLTFFPGLVFAWLRNRTGNIYTSFIFHLMCNAVM